MFTIKDFMYRLDADLGRDKAPERFEVTERYREIPGPVVVPVMAGVKVRMFTATHEYVMNVDQHPGWCDIKMSVISGWPIEGVAEHVKECIVGRLSEGVWHGILASIVKHELVETTIATVEPADQWTEEELEAIQQALRPPGLEVNKIKALLPLADIKAAVAHARDCGEHPNAWGRDDDPETPLRGKIAIQHESFLKGITLTKTERLSGEDEAAPRMGIAQWGGHE